MTSNQLSIEPLFELRRDVSMPGKYVRAGAQKPESEWKMQFPNLDKYEWGIWFLEIKAEPGPPINQKWQLANEVFKRKGLRSISYLEAAVECINEWERRILFEATGSKPV